MYPEHPPQLALYGPNKVSDYLTPSSATFIPLPPLMDPLSGVVGVDPVATGMIQANHEVNRTAMNGFYEKVSSLFNKFYYGVKDAVLKLDSLNQFYMDLYGHVDGSIRELARAKAVQLFKPAVRNTVAKKVEDKPITGLLDGEENLAAKIQENNKNEELISKVNFVGDFLCVSLCFQNLNKTGYQKSSGGKKTSGSYQGPRGNLR